MINPGLTGLNPADPPVAGIGKNYFAKVKNISLKLMKHRRRHTREGKPGP